MCITRYGMVMITKMNDFCSKASPSTIRHGESSKIAIKFTNPLNIPLSNVEIKLEGGGITPETIKVRYAYDIPLTLV